MDTKIKQQVSIYLLSLDEVRQIDDVATCVTVIFLISKDEEPGPPLAEFSMIFGACMESKTNVIFVPMQGLSESEWDRLSIEHRAFCNAIPKLCTIATWPGEGGRLGKLQWKNFCSKLQSSLPRPQGVDVENRGAVEQPLLEGPPQV